jgi:MoaA/NifB/PqqE/SkfB family radical SAM enzyme
MQPFQKVNRAAFVNFLRSKYELYTGAVSVQSRPYYLGLDPSSVCQLRCPVCATGVDNETHRHKTGGTVYRDGRTKLRGDLFDAVLDELGDYLFLIMFYNWGEPLLNQHLTSYIRKAKARNIETDVNSNLSLHLSDRQIEDLLQSGLDHLSASLDGFSQETYEMYRVGGNLELAKSNLERLALAKARLKLRTNISWNFMVFSFNEHEIPATRRYCEDLGIAFNARDGYIDDPDWLPSYRRNETPMAKPPEWRRPVVWSPLAPSTERRHASGCAWHYAYSMVNADGSVAPCCAAWNHKDDLGKVAPGVTTFGDIWNNELYRDVRAVFAGAAGDGSPHRDSLCGRCPFGEEVQHLYSLFDVKVMAQFYRHVASDDAILCQAFELLGKARYGQHFHDVLRQGVNLSTEVLDRAWAAEAGTDGPATVNRLLYGNERDPAAFVAFYQENLAAECQ